MRNYSPRHRYWAIGHTVHGDFHVSAKNTIYGGLSYFSPGSFSNHFTAYARNPVTSPQTIGFRVRGRWWQRGVSIGWKYYLKGSYLDERDWMLYTQVGFGLQFPRVENQYSQPIDTARYSIPGVPLEGRDHFRRLTLDLGLAAEFPIAVDMYVYGTIRTSVATTDYPSPFLHRDKHVPLPLIIGGGIRILFNRAY